jgi:hypothetical protein
VLLVFSGFLAGVVYTWERLFSTFNDVLSLSKSVEIPGKKPDLQGFERRQFLIKSHLLYQLSYEGKSINFPANLAYLRRF